MSNGLRTTTDTTTGGEQVLHASTPTTDQGDRPLKGHRGGFESDSEVLGARELAKLVGVTDRTLRRWRRVGDGPRQLPLSGHPRWSRRTVEAWLEGRRRR